MSNYSFFLFQADFGVILPRLSLLATITFSYSVLSPLINLLAAISFGMFYIAWKFRAFLFTPSCSWAHSGACHRKS